MNFMQNNIDDKKRQIEKESKNEERQYKSFLPKKEEEDSLESKSENEEESLSDSISEERMNLIDIIKIQQKIEQKKKKRKEEGKNKHEKHLLGKKRLLDGEPIIYNEKNMKIVNSFNFSEEELNAFLINCHGQISTLDDFSKDLVKESNLIVFNPNEWMESIKINFRTISMEDLSNYYSTKINEESNNNDSYQNIKKEEEKEEEKEIELKEEKEKEIGIKEEKEKE